MENREEIQQIKLAFAGEPGQALRNYLQRASGYPQRLWPDPAATEINCWWTTGRWHLVHDLLRLVDVPLPEPREGTEPHDDSLFKDPNHG